MHAVKRKNSLAPAAMLALLVLALGITVWALLGADTKQENPAKEPKATADILAGNPTGTEPEGNQNVSNRYIDPEKPMVALTFDDGPNGEYSPRILDCLEANDAVATFFEIGSRVIEHPELSKRAFDLGCEIGSHTYSHKSLTDMSAEEREEDRQRCKDAFEKAIGAEPQLIRPPHGSVVHSVMDASDRIFVGWSVDTEDWLYQDVDKTVDKVKQYGDLNGQVILMHSIYKESAEAAEKIIPWLIEQGYQLVTVSELFRYHYGITPEQHFYYAYDYFISDGTNMIA